MKILISPGHRGQLWLHPHRTDCNCTRKSRVVPMNLSRPSKSHAYSFDSCKPTKYFKYFLFIKRTLIGKSLIYHVIASPVFFDRHIAFWALFCVSGYPVGRLRVVIAFFYPFA